MVGHVLSLIFATQRLALSVLFAMQRHALSLLFAMQKAGLSSIASTTMHLLSGVASTSMLLLSGVARTSKHLPSVALFSLAPAASPPSHFWPSRPEATSVAVTTKEQLGPSVHFWAGVMSTVLLAILGRALHMRFRAPVSKLHSRVLLKLHICVCTGTCAPCHDSQPIAWSYNSTCTLCLLCSVVVCCLNSIHEYSRGLCH